jgi:hypothetical protein
MGAAFELPHAFEGRHLTGDNPRVEASRNGRSLSRRHLVRERGRSGQYTRRPSAAFYGMLVLSGAAREAH